MKTRFAQIVATHILLLKEEKILLGRRKNTGFGDGLFSLPGGHVESGETCLQATMREAHEELGVVLKPSKLKLAHVMHRLSDAEHRIDFFFAASVWTGTPKIAEPDKCDQLEWFLSTSLPNNTVPYIRQAIEHYCAKSIYSENGF